jgi:glutathione S-transferase
MKTIDSMISNKTSKFICGDSITVVDLVFYFNICNMVYFKRNHSDYPNTAEWFGNVYKIREVRAITHQWFSMAKQITKNIGKVEISPHL